MNLHKRDRWARRPDKVWRTVFHSVLLYKRDVIHTGLPSKFLTIDKRITVGQSKFTDGPSVTS